MSSLRNRGLAVARQAINQSASARSSSLSQRPLLVVGARESSRYYNSAATTAATIEIPSQIPMPMPIKPSAGQPTPFTNHHFASNDLAPKILSEEYEERRRRLVESIKADDAILIVCGHGLRYMTNGIFYPFHQTTDLLYLTGMSEPDVVLMLEKNVSIPRGYKMTLFCKPRDAHSDRWDGPRTGLDGAKEVFRADQAKSISILPTILQELYNGSRPIYTDLDMSTLDTGSSTLAGTSIQTSTSQHAAASKDNTPSIGALSSFFGRRQRASKTSSTNKSKVFKLKPFLRELRLIKSDAEIALMRTAGRITGRAFQSAMSRTRIGLFESWLHARIEYDVKRQGAWGLSYVPVVASGLNALAIHYVKNEQVMNDGSLVLVDAGCEYGFYTSDVTRTFPVNGKFNSSQKALYNAVLKVQKECIEKCTEAARVSLDDIHGIAMNLLKTELEALFGRGVTMEETRSLLAHHIGHYLGMDVHDTDDVPRHRRLVKGMVVTIEPGLYIPNDPNRYPPSMCGTGIRIEDDIAVGERDYIVLSAEAPKEVVDIEAIMAGIIKPHL
ncbi:hypothetical protein SmJEL517_g04387 [Synchytrium microbalum]|uniref:Aminopeptidase P N-terminal domain-containing protein n=1 Tax=Synchytrium microbalum TaxID=1806994 RepID=A0A507C4Q6_9FUNG|nr:uncharacterized protein SmJEL517_g04387 [Synchytrium microbalum]TPX32513.1 hypothetical protein SmJEL517_g04387 [Synchytrium microbalum]